MDTILHTQPDTHAEQETFDSAIARLRGAITKWQEKIPPNLSDAMLDQLDDIQSLFNDLMGDLMDQNQQLALEKERLILWKNSLANTTCFILTRLRDQSLREALERLHEKMNGSIRDPLPDPYLITIGL